MNNNFTQTLTTIKRAIADNKSKTIIRYSKQNLTFATMLTNNGLISGFCTNKRKKSKSIVLFIKYDYSNISIISDYSQVQRKTNIKPFKKCEQLNKKSNFIINLKTKKSNYSYLLARLR